MGAWAKHTQSFHQGLLFMSNSQLTYLYTHYKHRYFNPNRFPRMSRITLRSVCEELRVEHYITCNCVDKTHDMSLQIVCRLYPLRSHCF